MEHFADVKRGEDRNDPGVPPHVLYPRESSRRTEEIARENEEIRQKIRKLFEDL